MITIFNDLELNSFFIGTLLGDSYVYDNVFSCKQISKDLIDFKANFIKEHLPDAKIKINKHEAYTDKYGTHHQKYYQLDVRHPKVKELRDLFYKDNVKIYPKEAILSLTDIGFSMWYADDGTTILVQIDHTTGKPHGRRVQICTDNFTADEHMIIKEELESLGYNIKIIDRYRRGQLRIQFNDNYQNFICRLESTFMNFPSLLYKLDLGYRDRSLDKRTYVTEEYKNCFLRVSACPLFRDRIKEKMNEIEDDIVQTTNEDE